MKRSGVANENPSERERLTPGELESARGLLDGGDSSLRKLYAHITGRTSAATIGHVAEQAVERSGQRAASHLAHAVIPDQEGFGNAQEAA